MYQTLKQVYTNSPFVNGITYSNESIEIQNIFSTNVGLLLKKLDEYDSKTFVSRNILPPDFLDELIQLLESRNSKSTYLKEHLNIAVWASIKFADIQMFIKENMFDLNYDSAIVMKECIDFKDWLLQTTKFNHNVLEFMLNIMQKICAVLNRKFISIIQNLTGNYIMILECAKLHKEYDSISDTFLGKTFFAWGEIIPAQYTNGSSTYIRRYIQKLCYMFFTEFKTFTNKVPKVTSNELREKSAYTKVNHLKKTAVTDVDWIKDSIDWVIDLLAVGSGETYSIFWYDAFFPKFLPFFFSTFADVFDNLLEEMTISKNFSQPDLILELKTILSKKDKTNDMINVAETLLSSFDKGSKPVNNTYSSVDEHLRSGMDVGLLFAQAVSDDRESFDYSLLNTIYKQKWGRDAISVLVEPQMVENMLLFAISDVLKKQEAEQKVEIVETVLVAGKEDELVLFREDPKEKLDANQKLVQIEEKRLNSITARLDEEIEDEELDQAAMTQNKYENLIERIEYYVIKINDLIERQNVYGAMFTELMNKQNAFLLENIRNIDGYNPFVQDIQINRMLAKTQERAKFMEYVIEELRIPFYKEQLSKIMNFMKRRRNSYNIWKYARIGLLVGVSAVLVYMAWNVPDVVAASKIVQEQAANAWSLLEDKANDILKWTTEKLLSEDAAFALYEKKIPYYETVNAYKDVYKHISAYYYGNSVIQAQQIISAQYMSGVIPPSIEFGTLGRWSLAIWGGLTEVTKLVAETPATLKQVSLTASSVVLDSFNYLLTNREIPTYSSLLNKMQNNDLFGYYDNIYYATYYFERVVSQYAIPLWIVGNLILVHTHVKYDVPFYANETPSYAAVCVETLKRVVPFATIQVAAIFSMSIVRNGVWFQNNYQITAAAVSWFTGSPVAMLLPLLPFPVTYYSWKYIAKLYLKLENNISAYNLLPLDEKKEVYDSAVALLLDPKLKIELLKSGNQVIAKEFNKPTDVQLQEMELFAFQTILDQVKLSPVVENKLKVKYAVKSNDLTLLENLKSTSTPSLPNTNVLTLTNGEEKEKDEEEEEDEDRIYIKEVIVNPISGQRTIKKTLRSTLQKEK